MSTPEGQVKSFIELLQATRPQLIAIETKRLGTLYLRKQTGEDHLRIHALNREISKSQLHELPSSVWAAIVGSVVLLKADGTQMFDDAKEGYKLLISADANDLNEVCKALLSVQHGPKALEEAEKKSSSSQTSEPGTN